MDDLFFKLGRSTRRQLRKARWIQAALGASDAESIAAEYEAGLDLSRQLDRSLSFDSDSRSGYLLREVSSRLSARLTNKARRWHVVATLTEETGAYTLPGGFIYVTRPLIELCGFDADEIACVVGHEMAHVVHGDAMARIVTSAVGAGLGRLSSNLIVQWGLSAGANLLASAYSRDQELEADYFGAKLAHAAGYDPRAAIRALSRLHDLDTSSSPLASEYFASHPAIPDRIDRLNERIHVKN
jgi:Zn-dependent protease with chaperone function